MPDMAIHDTEEIMEHLVIIGVSGVHTIPSYTLSQMAAGKMPVFRKDQLDDDIDLVRGIIADWLFQVHGIDSDGSEYLN